MRVKLIAHTPNPVDVCAAVARTCTTKCDADTALGYRESDTEWDIDTRNTELVRKVLGYGHEGILEHASFTFFIEGISRAASHQLVRFRVASFGQQSQRYVKAPFGYVTPATVDDGHLFKEVRVTIPGSESWHDLSFHDFMDIAEQMYQGFVSQDVPAEDARFVLPNATCTNLTMTMNARELHHAFRLRLCHHAQWEIRAVFEDIFTLAKSAAPELFEHAGAPCEVDGTCPEGARCCGRVEQLKIAQHID